jgi:xanthine dehydrogenase YagR molybdenum-binding subunit
MKIVETVMETVARFAPDREPDPLLHARGYIGQPVSRVDGTLKVSGGARFSAEFELDGLAHAAVVCSTIAKGKMVSIDVSSAQAAAGVSVVMTHLNAPRIKAPSLVDEGNPKSFAASNLPIMQDDRIS